MKSMDLRSACPEIPDRFDRMVENALAEFGRAQTPRRRRASVVLIAALIAALLIAGLAYAASQSRILERLFPSGKPSEAAEQLVKPVKAVKTEGPYSISIDECLFDGNELHVDWTAKSESEELVLFTAGDLESPTVELLQQGWAESLQLNTFVPLGGSLNGRAVSRTFNGFTVVTLPDGIGDEPFDVTIRGAFMKPVAPIVPDDEIKENIACRPTWIAQQDGDQTYLNFASIVALEDGCRSLEAPDVLNYLDQLTGSSSQKERINAYLKALTAAGYAQPLLEMELTFTVSPDARHIYHTEIEGPSAFEFSDRTVTITKADFTAAHSSLEGLIVAKGGVSQEDLFKLYYEPCPDGKPTDVQIAKELNSGGPFDGEQSVELHYWGDPLPEAPSYVLLEAYWYPNGMFNQSAGKKSAPVRVPEYDITLRLKRVS